MVIGIPKQIKAEENRAAITPAVLPPWRHMVTAL